MPIASLVGSIDSLQQLPRYQKNNFGVQSFSPRLVVGNDRVDGRSE